MIEFKIDRHALRWPKMRESKVADFVRYTFQPGFSLLLFALSLLAVIAAVIHYIPIVWGYCGIVSFGFYRNYTKWRTYRGFK